VIYRPEIEVFMKISPGILEMFLLYGGVFDFPRSVYKRRALFRLWKIWNILIARKNI